jgi:hypothetical protein
LASRGIRIALGTVFWPDLGITKGDLLQYYADLSSALAPHLSVRTLDQVEREGKSPLALL